MMLHLKLGYSDLQSMPWEYLDWFYNRHTQYIVDLEQEQNAKFNKFG